MLLVDTGTATHKFYSDDSIEFSRARAEEYPQFRFEYEDKRAGRALLQILGGVGLRVIPDQVLVTRMIPLEHQSDILAFKLGTKADSYILSCYFGGGKDFAATYKDQIAGRIDRLKEHFPVLNSATFEPYQQPAWIRRSAYPTEITLEEVFVLQLPGLTLEQLKNIANNSTKVANINDAPQPTTPIQVLVADTIAMQADKKPIAPNPESEVPLAVQIARALREEELREARRISDAYRDSLGGNRGPK